MLKGLYRKQTVCYWIAAASLLAACLLSLMSLLHLCTQACAEGHTYRLFGYTFETIGLITLPVLTIAHLCSRKFKWLTLFVGWSLCALIGAEVIFIYVQKYKIGSWCPVCLSIAASILIAATAYFYGYYNNFKQSLEHSDRGQLMVNLYKGLTGIAFFIAGFVFAFAGIGKYNPLQAAENNIKEEISFGNLSSPIEVYVFTDWACPACRSLEPMLEEIAPKIMKKARLTFVDVPVHPETMNFTPYNVSFMINNKPRYFALRHALTAVSEETKTPTDEQIEALAAKFGQKYRQLNYADVALANKYFSHLVKHLDVEGTPTVVVVNRETQKGKKLPGKAAITEAAIMKAISNLSTKSQE